MNWHEKTEALRKQKLTVLIKCAELNKYSKFCYDDYIR